MRVFRHSHISLRAGISRFGLARFAPAATRPQTAGSLYQPATHSTRGKLLDLATASGNFKIMLLSLGGILATLTVGTVVVWVNHRRRARMGYCLDILPCRGTLGGRFF